MTVKECIQRIPIEAGNMSGVEKKIPSYPYALIYYMSEMFFGETEKLDRDHMNWDECVEAYFFGTQGQIHVYRDEDGLCAQEFTECDEMDSCIVPRYYYIEKNKWGRSENAVRVQEYLEPDEDGQMCVAYKRLCALENMKED